MGNVGLLGCGYRDDVVVEIAQREREAGMEMRWWIKAWYEAKWDYEKGHHEEIAEQLCAMYSGWA
jgi:hypothetical protein